MPTHKSCAKRMKTSEKERIANRTYRSQLRAAIKAVRAETDKDQASKTLHTATIIIDRAASKRIIPKKTADRNKSRLTLFVNRLGQ